MYVNIDRIFWKHCENGADKKNKKWVLNKIEGKTSIYVYILDC